jgi:hypothetical protein
MSRIEDGEQKLVKADELNCQSIQQKDCLEKVKQAEQEAQKLCKYELNMVQCNVKLNADVTQMTSSSCL